MTGKGHGKDLRVEGKRSEDFIARKPCVGELRNGTERSRGGGGSPEAECFGNVQGCVGECAWL